MDDKKVLLIASGAVAHDKVRTMLGASGVNVDVIFADEEMPIADPNKSPWAGTQLPYTRILYPLPELPDINIIPNTEKRPFSGKHQVDVECYEKRISKRRKKNKNPKTHRRK